MNALIATERRVSSESAVAGRLTGVWRWNRSRARSPAEVPGRRQLMLRPRYRQNGAD
jgi:hypothetical protein